MQVVEELDDAGKTSQADFIRHEYENLLKQIKELKASKVTLYDEISRMKSDAQWKDDGMMGCQMGQ